MLSLVMYNIYMEIVLPTVKYGDLVILIDDEDEEFVTSQKLYVIFSRKIKNFYVMTGERKYLHRLITNAPFGKVVHHKNHNTLDNRKSNLEITTASENGKESFKAYTDTQKLSKKDVKEILTSKLSQIKLSRKYNVSQCAISKIQTGEWYQNYCPEIIRREKNPLKMVKRFSEQQKRNIKKMIKKGVKMKLISFKYDIPLSILYDVKNGKAWKKIQ